MERLPRLRRLLDPLSATLEDNAVCNSWRCPALQQIVAILILNLCPSLNHLKRRTDNAIRRTKPRKVLASASAHVAVRLPVWLLLTCFGLAQMVLANGIQRFVHLRRSLVHLVLGLRAQTQSAAHAVERTDACACERQVKERRSQRGACNTGTRASSMLRKGGTIYTQFATCPLRCGWLVMISRGPTRKKRCHRHLDSGSHVGLAQLRPS